MKRVELFAATVSGVEMVDAWVSSPGDHFCANRKRMTFPDVAEALVGDVIEEWAVSHLPTGFLVPYTATSSRKEAVALAGELSRRCPLAAAETKHPISLEAAEEIKSALRSLGLVG